MKNNQINLLPIEYKKRHRRKWAIMIGLLFSLLLGLSLAALTHIPARKIQAAEKQDQALSQALKSLEIRATKELLEERRVAREEKARAAKTLDELDQTSHISRQTMDVIIANVPKGLKINQLLMLDQDQTITLVGQTQDIRTIGQYIVELTNTGQFCVVDYWAKPNQASAWKDYSLVIEPSNLIKTEEGLEEEVDDLD